MPGAALRCLLWCAQTLVLAEALQDHSGFSQENFAAYTLPPSAAHYKATCEMIAQSISSASQVFYPGEPQVIGLRFSSHIDPGFLDSQEFEIDISHWASSSSQVPVCSVEPGTSDDVASIVNLVPLPTHPRCSVDVIHIDQYSFNRSPELACRLQ
jgi:hypothetical protein